ncbi:family 78 glycoside hydrolase catalytic domain [Chitinophaga sp. CF418]|uniref:family 78 glycoside hydrolase catalytic domain n=1 Tax=Chitinophaga sp. CF418 TaxID=1855287 RepID=UPI0009157C69|nr:family 78 glycoside hydrolase catalytic domain [Chitinophaga sp. CF418]SHM93083.1 Alpha-L-rhamnosidase N-terminal domain-containing protein [Chitinophaga sp. CF418]
MRLCIIVLFLSLSMKGWGQELQTVNLSTDHKIDPIGTSLTPTFSWEITASQRGCMQTMFQIQLTEDSTLTGTKDTSARIGTSQSYNIDAHLVNRSILPAHKYYWRVRVWDNHGNVSSWSAAAAFTTALASRQDWGQAQWIGYEDIPDSMRVVPGVHSGGDKFYEKHKARQRPVVPLFRKEFPGGDHIKSALLFISGLGQYEVNLNGEKLGNSFLAPGWTDYDETVLYNTYDVTDKVKAGGNVLGVIVGNGFFNVNKERYKKLSIAYGMPRMICKLIITYANGTVKNIVSGEDWKTAPSPVTFASIYGGEDYDAQLEQKGWDQPSFDDAHWKQAIIVKATERRLEPELDHPVKVMEVLPAKTVTQPQPGVYMYDFGQNASGIVELKVKGKKGQMVKLIPAELLNASKLSNQKATGSPYYFSYTLKGDGEEIWRPRFTYYGFRYVQVEGAAPDTASNASLPAITQLNFLHTRNAAPATGSFSCANQLFNKIHTLIQWAIKSNLQSVATDCPHREKLSWLEQDYLMGNSIQYNYNISLLYRKLLDDMREAQTDSGLVPDIAPEYVFFDDKGFGFRDSPEWGSACVILPWQLYKWYGDTGIIRKAYPTASKYVKYLQSKAVNNILSHGLGDWYDNGPQRPGVTQLTPKALTAMAIYYYDLVLLSKMGSMSGDPEGAKRAAALAVKVKKAFNKQFFNPTTKVYATGSQTAMAMPLCVGLVNAQYGKAVFRNLVDSIVQNGKKLTAGDIGFHFLVQALQEGGASQLLYEMNNRDDVPGYGFQLAKGATALTESWAALERVSNNHLMLGHLMEWFYTGLGGITQQDHSIAYKEAIIRPEIVGDISWVKTSYKTVFGAVISEWEKKAGELTFHIVIPPNSSALIKLPAAKGQQVMQGGQVVDKQKDVKVKGYEDGRIILTAGSGDYRFVVK